MATPGTVVIVAVVPVRLLPSVPVTVVAVAEAVCVVNTTVAIPLAFVVEVAVANVPLPFDLDQVTVKPAVETALLLASASWAVIVTSEPAAGARLEEVTKYFVAVPGIVVIVAVAPVRLPPSVPVTVVAVAEAVCVVNATVAIPLALVVEVAVANEPLPLDFDHVTVRPAVETTLLFASASCALMVTSEPAAGLEFDEVTRYLVAAPGTVVIVPVVPVRLLPSVPVTVVAVAEAVCDVNATVAIPLALVVEVADRNEPLPFDLDHVTVKPAVETALLLASAS